MHPVSSALKTRALKALVVGGVFVAIVEVLGHRDLATPVPFWLLLPGILAGALSPDSGFNPEGDTDTHPWGPLGVMIAYAVNIVIYGGLAYVTLYLLHLLRRVFGAVGR